MGCKRTYNAIEDEVENEEDLEDGKLACGLILKFLMTEGTYSADNDFDNLLVSCDSKTMGDAA